MPRKKDKSLVILSLRLRKQDVAFAKKYAKEFGRPYQQVLRDWVRFTAETQAVKEIADAATSKN